MATTADKASLTKKPRAMHGPSSAPSLARRSLNWWKAGILVGGVRDLKSLTFKLKKALNLQSIASPFGKKKMTRILDAGKSASELADLIDADSTLPLQLAQISSGQLKLRCNA